MVISEETRRRAAAVYREIRGKLTASMPITNRLYNNTVNERGRKQVGGTCWFHAILNVFLLAPVGKRLLRLALDEYLKTQPVLLNIRNNACPMRGKINKQYFWSYVKYKLTNTNSGKASRNNIVGETHLIRNLKLRSENANTTGGTNMDAYKFIVSVFPSELIKLIRPVPFSQDTKAIPKEINFREQKYKLFGCFFSSKWSTGNTPLTGHAICGYISSDGSAFIYDSNLERSIRLDWVNDTQAVRNYFSRQYIEYRENSVMKGFTPVAMYAR
jgi:hypothetical protein